MAWLPYQSLACHRGSYMCGALWCLGGFLLAPPGDLVLFSGPVLLIARAAEQAFRRLTALHWVPMPPGVDTGITFLFLSLWRQTWWGWQGDCGSRQSSARDPSLWCTRVSITMLSPHGVALEISAFYCWLFIFPLIPVLFLFISHLSIQQHHNMVVW